MTSSFPHSLIIIMAFAAIYGVAHAVLDQYTLIAMENSILMAIGMGVAVVYLPHAARVLVPARRAVDRSNLLAFGIWISWIGVTIGRMISLYTRSVDLIVTPLDSTMLQAQLLLCILGGSYHVAAPVSGGRAAWWRLTLMMAAGMGVFTLLMRFRGVVIITS